MTEALVAERGLAEAVRAGGARVPGGGGRGARDSDGLRGSVRRRQSERDCP